jgi:hypothetical protein
MARAGNTAVTEVIDAPASPRGLSVPSADSVTICDSGRVWYTLPIHYSICASAFSAASMVRAMSSSVCAVETNAASNWLGAR